MRVPAAFYCTRDSIGIEKILLCTYHPYERIETGVEFLDALELSEAEKAKVCGEKAQAINFGPKP